MTSSQPSVAAVNPPPGWPPYSSHTGQRGDEWITAYNTYVNAWMTWASTDPEEDEDKWKQALSLIYNTKCIFSRNINEKARYPHSMRTTVLVPKV
ncbi:hypothetical protein FCIRC_2268 [Fusarium circinatum]|uniref:Uncharacterized protein n=1 Tax=Fusarium circinatum TaxID=48490 RepID=A0A8H5UK08_FUSCI|nr:hypothetical protein FCIRC_2268 [Fusarium circinatum]